MTVGQLLFTAGVLGLVASAIAGIVLFVRLGSGQRRVREELDREYRGK